MRLIGHKKKSVMKLSSPYGAMTQAAISSRSGKVNWGAKGITMAEQRYIRQYLRQIIKRACEYL